MVTPCFYVSIRKMNILVQYSKYLKMMTCPNKCLETGIFKLSIQNGGFWFVCENRFYGVKNPAQVFSSISRIYSWYVTNAINDPCQHLLWFINSRIVIFRVFALSMITNKLLEQFRLNRYYKELEDIPISPVSFTIKFTCSMTFKSLLIIWLCDHFHSCHFARSNKDFAVLSLIKLSSTVFLVCSIKCVIRASPVVWGFGNPQSFSSLFRLS